MVSAPIRQPSEDSRQMLDQHFTLSECEVALQVVPNEKAPVLVEFPVEHFNISGMYYYCTC